MSGSADTAAVALARTVLARERPAELPILDASGAVLLRDLATVRVDRRDDFLGIGADEAMALLTPVVLALGAKTADFLLGVARSTAEDLLKQRITAWFERPAEPLALPREVEARLRVELEEQLAKTFPAVETADIVDRVLEGLSANADGVTRQP